VRDLLTAIALAGATFVATSVDNLLLLVGFYGSERYRKRAATLGYVAVTAIAAVRTQPSP
jgi:hypothetical protein